MSFLTILGILFRIFFKSDEPTTLRFRDEYWANDYTTTINNNSNTDTSALRIKLGKVRYGTKQK